MNEPFSKGMAEATRLTRCGKVLEATALIQKLLKRRSAEAAPPQKVRPGILPEIESGAARSAEITARSAMSVATEQRATPSLGPSGFIEGTFANDSGVRNYRLYIPSSHTEGDRPLIVMLHGCAQSAEDFATGTRMNLKAEERGCFVLYPEQSQSANVSKCWNWFKRADQQRGKGEPCIIAGMVADVIARHPIDDRRVFVAGLSAGGAAAAVLAEEYPDIFSGVGIHSGVACGLASDMPSAFAAMKGSGAKSRRGRAKTFRPTIVFHGDRDTTVHPGNAMDIIERNPDIATLARTTTKTTAGSKSCSRTAFRNSTGCVVVEAWVIHGSGHAWSGGCPDGSFADAKGPDASKEMLRFFLDLQ